MRSIRAPRSMYPIPHEQHQTAIRYKSAMSSKAPMPHRFSSSTTLWLHSTASLTPSIQVQLAGHLSQIRSANWAPRKIHPLGNANYIYQLVRAALSTRKVIFRGAQLSREVLQRSYWILVERRHIPFRWPIHDLGYFCHHTPRQRIEPTQIRQLNELLASSSASA